MHGLRRPFARLRRHLGRDGSDHGAVAMITAIVLSGGLALGMGALVIDVGQLYVEREELQSGADAASWKIANNCVNTTTPATTCTPAVQTAVAVAYAQKNAKDGKANAQICFNDTGCPTWNTAITCPALATPSAGYSNGNYVEVRTSTLTSTNSTLFPPTFAGAIAGPNYQGKQVGTCARVNWGPPAVAKVFGLGISLCDWKRMTNNNTVYYGPVGSLLSQVGLFNLTGQNIPVPGSDSAIAQVLPAVVLGTPIPTCALLDPSPRGYVWLNNTDLSAPDANCMIDSKIGDYPKSFVLSGLGPGLGNRCAAILQDAIIKKKPVLVPIFDAIQQSLLSVAPGYRIAGYASFVPTGYANLLGGLAATLNNLTTGSLLATLNSLLCTTAGCIYGYFTKTLVPIDKPQFGTGTNYGATIIGRTG